MFCGKCGKQMLDGYEFCMHCGGEITVDLQENTTIPTLKKRVKTNMIFIPMIILAFVGIGLFIGSRFLPTDNGNFRNSSWGMSFEQVKKTETGTPGLENIDSLLYVIYDNKGLEGISTLVTYSFNADGELIKGTIDIVDDEMNSDDVCDDLIERYENLYGKQYEKTKYSYAWTTSKSVIKIQIVLDGFITVDFKDVNHK